MRLEVLAGVEAAAARGAELIAAAAQAAVAERGRFTLALSGGRTPWLMCERLGHEDVPWDATEIFQVDERIAPDGDPARNLTHLERSLPAAALERLRPMPVTAKPPEAGAASYAELLPDALDLVHLGLGPDGHTASLVPGDPVLEITQSRVALTGADYQGRRRMTLTYPALSTARHLLWLVTGAEKRHALAGLLASDPTIPAARVEARDAAVLADEAAAGLSPAGHRAGLRCR